MTDTRNRTVSFRKQKEKYGRANAVDAFAIADVLPNPDPILRVNGDFYRKYQDVMSDPHVQAVIASRKSVTTSKEWHLIKGDAPARVLKFVEFCFTQFDVRRATREILDAVLWGYQPMEPIWGTTEMKGENKIICTEFTGRPVYWFQYDKENRLRFRSKDNSWPGELIKPMSLLVPRNNPKYDNPYGTALLSIIYWSVNFKKGGFKWWVEFCEKYGQPFLHGKSDRKVGDTEFEAFYDRLLEMGRGAVIVTPDDADIEAVNLGSKGNADIFKELLDFANAEVSKALIGQTLTTEAGDKGARALGQVHDNVRHDIAESDEMLCEDCFNQLIRMIVDINFGKNIQAPQFKYDHEEDIKADLADRDQVLTNQGVKFTEEYYKKTYNLADNDFELTEPKQANPFGFGSQDTVDQDFQEGASQAAADQATDEFYNTLTPKKLQEQAEMVKPLLDLVKKSDSFEEVQDGMLDAFRKTNPEKFEKEMGRALMGAEMLGDVSGD